MLFVLHSRVLEGQEGRLTEVRPEHRRYIASGLVTVVSGGPTLSDDGAHIIGSVLVFEAVDRAAAEAFYIKEPYVVAGIMRKTLLEVFDKRL